MNDNIKRPVGMIQFLADCFRVFIQIGRRKELPQEPEGSKNRCPICGTHWDHHEFGVPHPYCPQEPLPGKSWRNEIPEGSKYK